MANVNVEVQKMVFDVSDPEITKVTIEIKHDEPTNILLKNKYEKSFPARLSALDLMKDYIFTNDHYLHWS